MSDYHSDRVAGPRRRDQDVLTPAVWGGIVSLLERGIARAWFGEAFPAMCEDGEGPYGCDERSLGLAIQAEIPDLDWPPNEEDVPATLAGLDLLEFMFANASTPTERDFHSFYKHHHLSFDTRSGQKQIRQQINRLLARGGMAYELDKRGRIAHLASPALEEQLRRDLPETRDPKFDELIERAITKFRNADAEVRHEALEPLWDAFERAKTILEPTKRRGSNALVAAMTIGAAPEETELVKAEMKALTEIGNNFRIRHHETDAAEVSDPLAEQLFARVYALLYRAHPALR